MIYRILKAPHKYFNATGAYYSAESYTFEGGWQTRAIRNSEEDALVWIRNQGDNNGTSIDVFEYAREHVVDDPWKSPNWVGKRLDE